MRIAFVLMMLGAAAIIPVRAAELTEQDLMQAATQLGRQYDANYNAKNAQGMAELYSPDGIFISPGPMIRGRADLQQYYQSRFSLGATGHLTKVIEVHLQGDGGFGVAQFAVTVPAAGGVRTLRGTLALVYRHTAAGWQLRLVAASVPPPASK